MNKIEKLHINAIKHNGWDNGTAVCFYNKDVEGYEGELEDAGKESAEVTKDIAIKFAKWLKHLDNGTTHYNPFTNKTTESIGFSPHDCYIDNIKSAEELFEEFLKTIE